MRITLLLVVPLIFSGCATVDGDVQTSPIRETVGELTVHFIDVGQGDSTFIQLEDGENILVDTGSASAGPGLVKYLKNLGAARIDHLVLTHPHDDHTGGIFNIVSELEVGNIYDNGFSNFNSTMYGDYAALVRSDLSKYHILQAGVTLRADGLKIEAVNPLLPPAGNPNEDSIALRVHFGDIIIFLSGDMGRLAERRLLKMDLDLRSHVLKTGHHGESDACSEEFLRVVNPDAAVISVGRINKYARPHPDVIRRLEDAGAKIYRTDLNGNIIVRTDGTAYSIMTEKE